MGRRRTNELDSGAAVVRSMVKALRVANHEINMHLNERQTCGFSNASKLEKEKRTVCKVDSWSKALVVRSSLKSLIYFPAKAKGFYRRDWLRMRKKQYKNNEMKEKRPEQLCAFNWRIVKHRQLFQCLILNVKTQFRGIVHISEWQSTSNTT